MDPRAKSREHERPELASLAGAWPGGLTGYFLAVWGSDSSPKCFLGKKKKKEIVLAKRQGKSSFGTETLLRIVSLLETPGQGSTKAIFVTQRVPCRVTIAMHWVVLAEGARAKPVFSQ